MKPNSSKASGKQSGAQSNAKQADIKVGLYSITYLGLWYRGNALTLPETIQAAKKFGFDGIEIDGKRPHGNPVDWPRQKCRELRKIADGEGVEIHAVAANNDFSHPVPEIRECQICYFKELIRMTADMGAKNLRAFLAWWGVTRHPKLATYAIAEGFWPVIRKDFKTGQLWDWCREALIECAAYAGDADVTLALQNHPPLIKSHDDLVRMVKEVDSPHLKLCLDAPLMPDKSPKTMRAAAQAVAPYQVLSHFGGEFEQLKDETIQGSDRHDGVIQGQTNQYYRDFIHEMFEIGYQGYISYELCHELPVVNGKTVDIKFAHKNARLAAEFMRRIIDEEKAKRSL